MFLRRKSSKRNRKPFQRFDEVGLGAISVEKQHVKTRHLRATVAAVHDLENERYSIKRHGKLEYQANLKRSSNLKYTYVSDTSKAFNTKLNPAAFHNINGEIGIDIVFPENYSIFIMKCEILLKQSY